MDSNAKKPLTPLFALWKMPSGKGYTGRLGDARVVVFLETNKKSEKSPDARVYVQEPDRKPAEPGTDGAKGPATNDDFPE